MTALQACDEWLDFGPIPRKHYAGETVTLGHKHHGDAHKWCVRVRDVDGRCYAARVYDSIEPAIATARAWALMQGSPTDDFE